MKIESYSNKGELLDVSHVINDIIRYFKTLTSVVYRLDKCIERLELHDNSAIEVLDSIEAYLSSSDFGPQQLEQLIRDITEVHKDALANLSYLQDTGSYLTQAKAKKSKFNANNISTLLPFISKAMINANELPSFVSRANDVEHSSTSYGQQAIGSVINTVNTCWETISQMNVILSLLPLPKDDPDYNLLPEKKN